MALVAPGGIVSASVGAQGPPGSVANIASAVFAESVTGVGFGSEVATPPVWS